MKTMMPKRRGLLAVLAATAVLLIGNLAGAQSGQRSGETFKARLSVVPIDVTMQSTVAGLGSATAVLTGNKLTVSGTFDGLRSPATVARIHRGPKGIPGPAVFDLTISKATSGTLSGSVELTSSQVDDLKNGRFYVQIDSERAPDGNLWGWLLR